MTRFEGTAQVEEETIVKKSVQKTLVGPIDLLSRSAAQCEARLTVSSCTRWLCRSWSRPGWCSPRPFPPATRHTQNITDHWKQQNTTHSPLLLPQLCYLATSVGPVGLVATLAGWHTLRKLSATQSAGRESHSCGTEERDSYSHWLTVPTLLQLSLTACQSGVSVKKYRARSRYRMHVITLQKRQWTNGGSKAKTAGNKVKLCSKLNRLTIIYCERQVRTERCDSKDQFHFSICCSTILIYW